MIFKKRNAVKKAEERLYFRDSLTGLWDKASAYRVYETVKHDAVHEAVMVRLSSCKDMPYYKAEAFIRETGALLPRICNEDIFRIEAGDFVIFSKNARDWCKKLDFFLARMTEKDVAYAVACDKLDENEDFVHFLSRLRRHVGTVEIANSFKCGNLAKNT